MTTDVGGIGAARPVRVLHVLGRLSPGGGIQIVVRGLIEHLDRREVELCLAVARERGDLDGLDALPVDVHRLGIGRARGPVARLRTMLRVVRLVRRLRPDVVHVHSGTAWMGMLASVAAPRRAYVLEQHVAPDSGHHSGRTDRLEGAWARWLGVTVLSHSTSVDREVRDRWKVPAPRRAMIPLAVDTDLFRPRSRQERAEWRREHGVPEHLTLLVTVGRLVDSKRFDRAIHAVAVARASGQDLGLVVVGRGPMDEQLRALSVDEGVADRVWFIGPRYGEELAAAVGSADVLCSPSEYEGFGLTIIEGMACGIPPVAVAVGGVTDLIEDGVSGVLVDEVDAVRFGEVANEFARSPVDMAHVAARVRDVAVGRFGVAAFVRSTAEFYCRVGRSATRKR